MLKMILKASNNMIALIRISRISRLGVVQEEGVERESVQQQQKKQKLCKL
jgi:hypothetical protein